MDAVKRDALIKSLGECVTYNGGCAPIVWSFTRIERYFDGADGMSGILCNTSANLSDKDVMALLVDIRGKDEVHDVRLVITQCNDDEWPFSDHIVVVTSASKDAIQSWFPEEAQPDECYPSNELGGHVKVQGMIVPHGHVQWWLWFD